MRFIFLFYLLFCTATIFGQQATITILDKDDLSPLIGATIHSDQIMGVTNINGQFSAIYTDFPTVLEIRYIGYESQYITIGNRKEIPNQILMSNMLVLQTMTVTASKYEKRLSESTVSVDVLKPDLIANTNTINIDQAINKVPGVQMIDGQANIRGGSGYSYGAGSRVMLLIDNVPALQADAGFPNWSDIPVENIDQVEIVKGAASALYGSSALNGIINIRTGTPSAIPQTKIATSYLIYDSPKDSEKKWWGDTTRYSFNISAVHKAKYKNLDIVASGYYQKEEEYNQATYINRWRTALNLKYRITDKLFLRINTLLNKGNNGDFFIWRYADHNALKPFEGSTAIHDVLRYFVDPSLVFQDNYGNTHRLLTRFHSIKNNNSGNQSNESSTLFGEYQFQRKIDGLDALVTTGILMSKSNTDAELFGDTTFTTKVFATYLQLEKKFFEKLNLSGGLRYEYNKQLTPTIFDGVEIPNGEIKAGKLIARIGASYEYMPYSSVRASWGQGYRFPTVTERFITTTFGIFNIRANPSLVPESGWSAELGIKHGFKFGGFQGFFDVAAFTSEYQDMMEFVFGLSIDNGASFMSQNVGSTKISGIEFGVFGDFNIGSVSVSTFGGYTYINPKYKNFDDNIELQKTLSANENVLKYRSKHSGKMDLQFSYKQFSFGGSLISDSHQINIDAVLEGRGLAFGNDFDLLGLKAYREINNDGYTRLDLRVAYKWKNLKTSFLINNITNKEYSVRPALLEAPRNFALRLDYVINHKKSSL
ncbi:MAG: TonB-dependent receptor [Saprospiraceae bacterium]